MSCSVDPIAWGEKNRVSLATGKTHEWVLARTQRDRPAVDEVVRTARAVMVKWFDGIALDVTFADAGSAVDAIRVDGVLTERPVPQSGDQRREQCDPVPLLAAADRPPLYVKLSFNYRGFETSLPWPVWTATSSIFKVDKLCPEGADWMLVQAKQAAELAPAPPELGPLDKLAEGGLYGSGELAKAIGDLGSFVKWAGYGLVLYGAVQLAGFIPRAGVRLPAPRASRSSRSHRRLS
jgi:hypothetical protein